MMNHLRGTAIRNALLDILARGALSSGSICSLLPEYRLREITRQARYLRTKGRVGSTTFTIGQSTETLWRETP